VLFGLPVVALGLAMLAFGAPASQGGRLTLLGDALFLLGGAMWAGFTFLGFRWSVKPLQAATVVAVLSMAFIPVHFAFLPSNLHEVPWSAIAFHAAYQGPFVLILGVLVWSYGVNVVGTEVASRFSSLVPVAGFLMAVPLLGEWPAPLQWAGMAVAVSGLLGMAIARGWQARR
jgi:drug/metabolite transporter (DMT)-like permease